MDKTERQQIRKILSAYGRAVSALNALQHRTLGKESKDVIESAKMAVIAVQGKCEEALHSMKRKSGRPKPGWAEALPKETILKALDYINGDGHSLYAPVAFTELGIPRNIVRHYTRVYSSDIRNPKEMMFDQRGRFVSHMKGIYGLDILRALANDLNAPDSSALGRGFEARELTKNIKDKLNEVAA
jgi:hypothetical protein